MSALPDGWSDCTDQMEDKAAGAVRDHVEGKWHPWLAWLDGYGVTCLDDEDNEVDPPEEVVEWLKQQAREPTP